MENLSLYLTGIVLTLVSVVTILYSVYDLRDTSLKRHKFFKGIRLFFLLFLLPAFLVIIILNIRELLQIATGPNGFLTMGNSAQPIIYIISAVIAIIISIIFIFNPVNNGIRLFRKHNRDNLKYGRALTKSRNGLVLIIVIAVIILVLVI